MVLRLQTAAEIKEVLRKNPQGLNITEIVRKVRINRNTAGRCLEKLLISGQVEMRHFGMAKIYAIANRVPISAVLSISSELILQLDSSTRIVFINDAFARFLGMPADDLVGKNVEYTPLATAFDTSFPDFFARVIAGLDGAEWRGEIGPVGDGIFFSCRIAPTALDHGQKGVSLILEDITGRKTADALLRESEERYRMLAEISSDLIFLIDDQDRVEYVNSYSAKFLGLTPAEIMGKKRSSLFPPPIADRQDRMLRGVFSTGCSTRSEGALQVRGETRWFDHVLVPLKKPDGSVRAVLGISRDITERKKSEEILKSSEERYRTLVEHSQSGVFIIQRERIQYVNTAFARILGGVPADFAGQDFSRFIAPEDRAFVLERGHRRQNGEKVPENYECRLLMCDGKTQVLVSIDAGLITFKGSPASMGTIRDITGQRQSENALKESTENLRAIFDSTFQFTGTMTPDGILTDANTTALNFLGVKKEDVIGRPFWQTGWWKGDPGRVRKLREAISAAARGEFVRYEVTIRGAGDSAVVADFSIKPVFSADGKVRLLIPEGRDITGRKYVEEAFRDSEEQYRLLFDDGPLGMAIVGGDHRFVSANRMFCGMLGYSSGELTGKIFVELADHPHQKKILTGIKKLFAGEIRRYLVEGVYIKKDGSPFRGSMTLRPLRDRDGKIVSALALLDDLSEKE